MNEPSFASGLHPTRVRILEAALRLFSERGYDGTAVPVIATEAGIAAGTMYRHFSGKEELVNELFRALCYQLEGHLAQAVRSEENPHEWYAGLWTQLLDFGLRYPQAYEFIELHHHGSYLDEDSRQIEARAFSPFLLFFEAASAALRPVPASALLAMVRGLAAGLLKAQVAREAPWPPSVIEQSGEAAWTVVSETPSLPLSMPSSTINLPPNDWRVW